MQLTLRSNYLVNLYDFIVALFYILTILTLPPGQSHLLHLGAAKYS